MCWWSCATAFWCCEQLLLGGNDSYIAMCHKCWIRGIRERRKIKLHGNGESIDL